jgi:chromate transporter
MMPAMRQRMVDKKGWLTNQEFGLGLGLCQSLPGGTLMQLAAYTGMRLAGLNGAVGAYCGFSLPAFHPGDRPGHALRPGRPDFFWLVSR